MTLKTFFSSTAGQGFQNTMAGSPIFCHIATAFHESNQVTTLNLFLLQNISKWLKVVFAVNLRFKKIYLGWEHCTSHSRGDEA